MTVSPSLSVLFTLRDLLCNTDLHVYALKRAFALQRELTREEEPMS